MITVDPVAHFLDILASWDNGCSWEAPFVARLWECILAMEENRPHESIYRLMHEHHHEWCSMKGLL